jgi:hypothetical protein
LQTTSNQVSNYEVESCSSMVEMAEDFLQLIENPDQALAKEMRNKWFPPFHSDCISSAGYKQYSLQHFEELRIGQTQTSNQSENTRNNVQIRATLN